MSMKEGRTYDPAALPVASPADDAAIAKDDTECCSAGPTARGAEWEACAWVKENGP